MKPILEIQNITKQFLINAERERYLAIRDIVSNTLRKLRSPKMELFTALDHVNFDVYSGDSVGIIGRNGAGKSTLLKILSRITPPSAGRIISRGRIASLLEVGTGFHPELTGRENIYMNGSILGMRKWEIDKHFDEIVAFSGVEQFLDTPLKRFSSGMQLRLAFAVAAYLEPEILIVDEVLAVGDAEFQKRCLGKMNEISKSGRTVLFVSHHMGTIAQLCKKILILERGKVLNYTTDTMAGIEQYMKLNKSVSLFENSQRVASEITVSTISLSDASGQNINEFTTEEDIFINIELDYDNIPPHSSIFVTVINQNKMPVFSSEVPVSKRNKTLKVSRNFLVQGSYSLNVIVHHVPVKQFFSAEDICQFSVLDTNSEFIIYNNHNYNYGNVFGKANWI
jgi:lipopolysaccharide transport system ATP-binding protein